MNTFMRSIICLSFMLCLAHTEVNQVQIPGHRYMAQNNLQVYLKHVAGFDQLYLLPPCSAIPPLSSYTALSLNPSVSVFFPYFHFPSLTSSLHWWSLYLFNLSPPFHPFLSLYHICLPFPLSPSLSSLSLPFSHSDRTVRSVCNLGLNMSDVVGMARRCTWDGGQQVPWGGRSWWQCAQRDSQHVQALPWVSAHNLTQVSNYLRAF